MDDSPEIDDLTFDEQIELLIEDLPLPIQDFIRSPERDATSLRLSQKYNIHADQAGAFEKAYLYMLLGVNTPEDFFQDLRDAGIAQDVIRGLGTDINEQVFKRLQQEELQAPTYPAPAAYRTTSQPAAVPVMQIAPQQQIVQTTAPAQVTTFAPQSISALQPQPTIAETPSYNLIRPGVFESAPIPELRTMRGDMEAVQHSQQQVAGYQPNPAHATPARTFQTASVPFTSTPPPSPLVPIQPTASSTYQINQIPVQQPSSLQAPVPQYPQQIAIPRNYSADPYREIAD